LQGSGPGIPFCTKGNHYHEPIQGYSEVIVGLIFTFFFRDIFHKERRPSSRTNQQANGLRVETRFFDSLVIPFAMILHQILKKG
jgi:hypothetical protein